MTDLHSRLVAALQAQLEVAKAVPGWMWPSVRANLELPGAWPESLDAYIAANDPAATIRHVEALLRVIAAYNEAVAFYNAPENRHVPAGEVQGLLAAIKILAAGEGIEP